MNAAKNFALIDNCSGYIWWHGAAKSPESACRQASLDTGNDFHDYEAADSLASNESGYHVYAVDENFDVIDATDSTEIAAISALPCYGSYRAVFE